MDQYVREWPEPKGRLVRSRQGSHSKGRSSSKQSHRIFSWDRLADSLHDLSRVGQINVYPAGSYLFRQNAPADSIFEINSGLVITYHITSSGDRRIVDFFTAGELIGIASRGAHRLACQAVTSAEVAVLNREAVLSTTNKRVVEKLWSEIISERLKQEQHIVWLGSSAKERISSFLLTMADRRGQNGHVELPITRRELSEYLGLTVECFAIHNQL